jgi:TetR/AcrR family fatty acid metabolism transcriptional regulator
LPAHEVDPSVVQTPYSGIRPFAHRMPSRTRKEDVISEFRRSQLILSARRVFGAHGFAHATMDEIAREAAVAKGTVYLYYRSKREIYDAAFKAGMAELEDVTRDRVKSAGSIKSVIAVFVTTRVQYFQARRDFFRMYMDEISSRVAAGAPRRTVFSTMIERQTRVLEQAIAGAAARGEIRDVDPEATALAIFDMTRGLVARHLLTLQRGDSTRDAAFLTDLIWTGLRPGRRKQTQ